MMSALKPASIATMIEFTVDTARLDEFLAYMAKVAPGTRGFAGNLGFSTYADPDNPAHVLHHVAWDSLASQQRYMAWRESTGVFDIIRSFIIEGPLMTYWRLTDTY